MLIITNFCSFPAEWTTKAGIQGRSVFAREAAEFEAYRNDPDSIFLINCDPGLTLELSGRNLVKRRRPLIVVDLVLREPASFTSKAVAPMKRFLFSRADHFIHYFRDVSSYEKAFGLEPGRSSFVPFKVNLKERNELKPLSSEGEYVLCFGRSLRDFDTFFAAVDLLPYKAAIAQPDFEQLRANSARFTRSLKELPATLQLLEDDGSEAAQVRILSAAKVVVLPILKKSMVASGISTCLNAMMLGKCVVGSEGPGMSDVFTQGEVITVSPENPAALAAAIRRVWEDDLLRERTAAAGHAYAVAAGGEKELYQRIIENVVEWWQSSRTKRIS